jgi:hypothetical protein
MSVILKTPLAIRGGERNPVRQVGTRLVAMLPHRVFTRRLPSRDDPIESAKALLVRREGGQE